MANIPGTILAAMISPGDTSATFATHEDIYGKGGLMSFTYLSSLSAIPLDRQKVGGLIYIDQTKSYYRITSTGSPLTGYTLFSNLTSTVLSGSDAFITNNLTVTNTVSAKYYKGTIVDWMTLVRGYKTTPTLNTTIAGGDVYTYVYATTGSDKTYYRYIATNGSEDSFYETFSGGVLSNKITTKKIIL